MPALITSRHEPASLPGTPGAIAICRSFHVMIRPAT
jgi:hypothetical protein